MLALQLVEVSRGLVDAPLELGDPAVADLGGDVEIGLALELRAQVLELLLEVADGVDRLLLGLPVLLHRRPLDVELGELVVEGVETLPGRGVALLLERHLFDLELQDPALDDVDLGRHRIDLDPQLGCRLVDEVDRLVGQEPVGEVAVGQHGGADERRILDPHTVMDLVALLEAAQDADRVLDRRLAHVDLLEAALEGSILLDVLAVLVEGGGADHAQLAASEHRLDHVAGVHRSLGTTGADDRVQLVDERDHLAGGVGDLLEHRLQTLLELAAVLGTGEHRADVERDQALALQALGHVAVGDPPRQAFDDRRLADARFADQHRVVLGAPREHLDDTPDLVVAADHRVDLALGGAAGEVLPVLLEGGELLLRVLVGDAVAAAHVAQHAQQLLAADPEPVVHRQQQVLDGDVVVLEVLAVLLGPLGDVVQLARQTRLVTSDRARELLDRGQRPVAHHAGRLAELGEHGGDDRAVLVGERHQQVIGCQLGIVVRSGLVDGRGEGLLGLDRPLLGVECHVSMLPPNRADPDTNRLKFHESSSSSCPAWSGSCTETSTAIAVPITATPASDARNAVTAGSEVSPMKST